MIELKVVRPLFEVSQNGTISLCQALWYSPIRDRRQKCVRTAEVKLRILESLSDLRPNPLLARNVSTSLIPHNASCRHALLVLIHPDDLGRAAQEYETDQRKYNRTASKKHGDCSPRSQATIRLGIRSNAVHHEAGDDVEAGIRGLPEERARGVLIPTVPGAYDEDEAGRDCAFEEALQGADGHQV